MLSSPTRPSDTLVRVTTILAAMILAAYLATRALLAASPDLRALTGEILLGGASLEAVVVLALAARAAARTSSRAGLAWSLLAAAQVCRLAGDISASWSGPLTGNALPGLSDLAYTAFYPLFIAG